jgi:hypothetical protein
MPPKFRSAPFPAFNVHVQISGRDFLIPGLVARVRGNLSNVAHAFNQTVTDEAMQITKQENMVPLVRDGSVSITVCAGLIKVFERTHQPTVINLRFAFPENL